MRNEKRSVFLSINDVAEILGLNERTVRRLIKARKLAAHQVGHQWRISKEDLEAYLAARYQATVRDVL